MNGSSPDCRFAPVKPANRRPVHGILSQQTALRETYGTELKKAVDDAKVAEVKYDAVIGAALWVKEDCHRSKKIKGLSFG